MLELMNGTVSAARTARQRKQSGAVEELGKAETLCISGCAAAAPVPADDQSVLHRSPLRLALLHINSSVRGFPNSRRVRPMLSSGRAAAVKNCHREKEKKNESQDSAELSPQLLLEPRTRSWIVLARKQESSPSAKGVVNRLRADAGDMKR